MPEAIMPDSRRQHERWSKANDGRIRLNDQWHPCRTINVSVGGAQLWVEHEMTLGSDALLEIGNFGQFRVNVAWRRGNDVGVKFAHDPAEMADVVMGLATYG